MFITLFKTGPPFVFILNQIHSVHTVPSYLFEIYFNIILLSTSRSSKLFISLGFPTKTL